MRTLWRGNANAWECDEMGHLNVRPYLAKAMEAGDGLCAALGLSPMRPTSAHVRYLAEARAGAPLYIVGGLADVGRLQCQLALEMRHALTDKPAAGFAFTLPQTPTSVPSDWRLEAPIASALPHGVPASAAREAPDQAEAIAAGGVEIGRGVFRADECDSEGLVRLDALIGRISDSVAFLLAPIVGPPNLDTGDGGAVMLEARLNALAPARRGRPFTLVSALVEARGRTARAVHVICDAVDGGPLASVEAVLAFFDLKERRARAPEGPALERLLASLRPSLRL